MSDETNMKDRLDWIEKAGIENMKTQHACADYLIKEASTTLTITLAGMGGGLAYAVKAIEAHHWSWLSVGAGAFTAWLLFTSWYITTKCLMVSTIDQVYNDPKNLDAPEDTFEYLRQCELLSLQERISRTAKRNAQYAERLNRARKFAIFSPAIFIAASMVWKVWECFSVAA
ncbi:hypothetical protein [Burkholderia multivorans]|uniref:hypothetical protein n=1 Tax=Burkholderia multivorans TaxID=87883 RepID=UPI002857ACFA|nr:hypothetical protein [Burkholderia multivorans]MDR8873540.1 hypothetical protein [Burkholderia multivorans]MDR8889410.1 hypothetical protein [Burkholderia multivorans]MDR8891796.1 hypothetical protein [Burkholderia multivorans]MDR8898422.1 hypothetical protein [Burkholderia multivorans]MDR8903959.1 hypothetical protein [Burkholderia multivorans]